MNSAAPPDLLLSPSRHGAASLSIRAILFFLFTLPCLGFSPGARTSRPADDFEPAAKYAKGNFERTNGLKEIKVLVESANAGELAAQDALGTLYSQIPAVGLRDYQAAMKWYRMAADRGYPSSEYGVGMLYYYGQGVPQDYSTAARWYRKAADHGSAAAQADLGLMYYLGQGVTQNYDEARSWYQQAAGNHDPSGQSKLGMMCFRGEGGPRDLGEAVKWFRAAAESGRAVAQYNPWRQPKASRMPRTIWPSI
jgi:TPR repeat protein